MKPYSRITIWENCRRAKLLKRFFRDIGAYLKHPVKTGKAAAERRFTVNAALLEVREIVEAAGASVMMHYAGQSLDVFLNVFQLQEEAQYHALFDNIQRAVGVYEGDRYHAWVRTLNVFGWIDRGVGQIAAVPLGIFRRPASDQGTSETHWFIRLCKAAFWMVALTGGVLAVLDKLGVLPRVQQLIGTATTGPASP